MSSVSRFPDKAPRFSAEINDSARPVGTIPAKAIFVFESKACLREFLEQPSAATKQNNTYEKPNAGAEDAEVRREEWNISDINKI